MVKASSSKISSDFLEIKEDLRIYSNLIFILEKVQVDNTFSQILSLFQDIFEKEMNFTIKGCIKRTEKTQTRFIRRSFELRTLPKQHKL